MRILVRGSRDWKDLAPIRYWLQFVIFGYELTSHPPPDEKDVLVHGGHPGAERIAAKEARDVLEIETLEIPMGNRAGPLTAYSMQSEAMVRAGKPDVALLFHGRVNKTKGPDQEILEMQAMLHWCGVPAILITERK